MTDEAAKVRDDLPGCHLCGKEAAAVIDGIAWCASCLHARGSCCAESEMEDPENS